MKTIRKTLFACLIFTCVNTHANQTVFEAGSTYKGQFESMLEHGFYALWKCDGVICKTSGSWPQKLSQESCRNLAAKVGDIQFFRNNDGKIWEKDSSELNACNQKPQNITWTSGSSYRGTILIHTENRPNMKWYCDGTACNMSAPFSNHLTLEVCQKLVEKVGKVSYYRNSAGKSWGTSSQELIECNNAPRKMNHINAFG